MKAISVLWNSMDSFQNEAIDDIQKFSQIEASIELDLADNFPIFLQDIYSYHAPEEQWKLDYKLQQTINMYNSRKVTIIFLILREIDTIFDDRKKVEMIRQVKELKDFMRNKYSNGLSTVF